LEGSDGNPEVTNLFFVTATAPVRIAARDSARARSRKDIMKRTEGSSCPGRRGFLRGDRTWHDVALCRSAWREDQPPELNETIPAGSLGLDLIAPPRHDVATASMKRDPGRSAQAAAP
jgi:hypothetical protein